jgi:hypothetical protein
MTDVCYARLSLPPSLLFFDAVFFTYEFTRAEHTGKMTFYLRRSSIPTRFGFAVAGELSHIPASRLADQLQELASGREIFVLDDRRAKEFASWPSIIRKALQVDYHILGLRNLLVTRDNHYYLACDSSRPVLPNP